MKAHKRLTNFSSRKKTFKFIRDTRIDSWWLYKLESETLSELWHKRHSHISERGITCLAKKNTLAGMKQTKVKRCVHFFAGKQKRVYFHSHPPSISHMSERGITCLAKKNLLAGMKQTKVKKCVCCLAGKQKRVSLHNHPPSRKSELFDLVHTDLCGSFKVKSKGGALYFATFIDYHSRKIPLKSKDQVLDVFK